MVISITSEGLQSVTTPFERSNLGQAIRIGSGGRDFTISRSRSATSVEEQARKKALAEIQRKQEEEKKRLEEEKKRREEERKRKAEEQRQKRVTDIQTKRNLGKPLTQADLMFERSQRARELRMEARERGVDISTPTRELGFISQIRREQEQTRQAEEAGIPIVEVPTEQTSTKEKTTLDFFITPQEDTTFLSKEEAIGRLSFFEATKQSERILKEDIFQFVSPKKELEFKNPLDPFEYTGKTEKEVKENQFSPFIKSGTITPDESPFITLGEQQKQIDVDKISGISTLKLDVISPTARTGKKIKEFGSFVGESALFVTPQTSILGFAQSVKEDKTKPATITSKGDLYPYQKEGIDTAFSGAMLGGFGVGEVRATERALIQEEFRLLGQQPVKFKSLKIKGEGADLDIIKGTQEFRGLKTEFDFVGKSFKEGDKRFIIPKGSGRAETKGTLGFNLLTGQPTKVSAIQEFEFGAKGFTFPVSKKVTGQVTKTTVIPDVSSTIFYGTKKPRLFARFSPSIRGTGKRFERKIQPLDVKRQAKEVSKALSESLEFGGTIQQDYSFAFSKKLNKEFFVTKSGKIKGLDFNLLTGDKKMQVNIATDLKDTGITKIIYPPKPKETRFIKTLGTKPKTPLSKTFASDISKKPSFTKPPMTKIDTATTEISSAIDNTILGKIGKQTTNKISKVIPKTEIKPQIAGLTNVQQRDLVAGLTKTQQQIKIKEDQKTKGRTAIADLKVLTDIKIDSKLDQPILIAQPKIKQKTIQDTKFAGLISGFVPKPTIRPKPKTPTPIIILPPFFDFRTGRGVTPTTNQPYNVYVKSKGVRKKVTKKPVSRRDALNLLSYTLDNSLSATGSIKKAKGGKKAINPLAYNIPPTYYQQSFGKFRTYRQKKGVKIPLRQTFIELQGNRLDTRGEINKIQAERLLAQRKKQVYAMNMNKLMGGYSPQPRKSTKKKKKSRNSYLHRINKALF